MPFKRSSEVKIPVGGISRFKINKVITIAKMPSVMASSLLSDRAFFFLSEIIIPPPSN